MAGTDRAADEAGLVRRLRAGDEEAFRCLVRRHQGALRRTARLYVPESIVDEVVQETWLGVIGGIDRFEGRSSVKTWVFRILLNQARRRGSRERRTVPVPPGPTIEPGRLVNPELGEGYWPAPPPTWDTDPERALLGAEVREAVRAAIAGLPSGQRDVIALRDVEGWASHEVCDLLRISAVNQRVLLHRARATVRQALEEHFDGA